MNSHSYFPLHVLQASRRASTVAKEIMRALQLQRRRGLRFECRSLSFTLTHSLTRVCVCASSLRRLTLLAECSLRNETNCTQPAAQLLLFLVSVSLFGLCLCCWAVLRCCCALLCFSLPGVCTHPTSLSVMICCTVHNCMGIQASACPFQPFSCRVYMNIIQEFAGQLKRYFRP